jgi:hypothetical protein
MLEILEFLDFKAIMPVCQTTSGTGAAGRAPVFGGWQRLG